MKLRQLKEMPPLTLEEVLAAESREDEKEPIRTEGQTTAATKIEDLDELVGMRDPVLLRPVKEKP